MSGLLTASRKGVSKGGNAMRTVSLLSLVCISTVLLAMSWGTRQKIYRAELSGSQEVPRVNSAAQGDLKLVASENEMSFELNVKGINTPTAAHIHKGKEGENGPPVAGLFGGPAKTGSFKGILAQGLITEQTLMGELEGKTVADLARLIESGRAYVNILSETYPMGEIRGQIK